MSNTMSEICERYLNFEHGVDELRHVVEPLGGHFEGRSRDVLVLDLSPKEGQVVREVLSGLLDTEVGDGSHLGGVQTGCLQCRPVATNISSLH